MTGVAQAGKGGHRVILWNSADQTDEGIAAGEDPGGLRQIMRLGCERHSPPVSTNLQDHRGPVIVPAPWYAAVTGPGAAGGGGEDDGGGVAQAAVDCGNVRSLPACRWIPVQIQ